MEVNRGCRAKRQAIGRILPRETAGTLGDVINMKARHGYFGERSDKIDRITYSMRKHALVAAPVNDIRVKLFL